MVSCTLASSPIIVGTFSVAGLCVYGSVNQSRLHDPFTCRERLNIVAPVGQPCRKPDIAVASACRIFDCGQDRPLRKIARYSTPDAR
jgi:hypothetical protein